MCLTRDEVLLYCAHGQLAQSKIMNTSKEMAGFCKLFATIILGLRFEMKAEYMSYWIG